MASSSPFITTGSENITDGERMRVGCAPIELAGHFERSVLVGLSIPSGQSSDSGHRLENHCIARSYVRAVNEAPLSIRSKKRQSPQADCATVVPADLVARQYRSFTATRFCLSSTSIVRNNNQQLLIRNRKFQARSKMLVIG
jgi:hypothetical protein